MIIGYGLSMDDVADRAPVRRLAEIFDTELSRAIPVGSHIVVFDFPYYPNPGDAAIWCGTRAWLSRRGCTVRDLRRHENLSLRSLPDIAPHEVILFMGGGNFGDLYPEHQRARDLVLRNFSRNRFVQFPQTLNYADVANASTLQHAMRNRPNTFLYWRDRKSLASARSLFPGANHFLAPDAACGLEAWYRPMQPTDRLGLLQRQDLEARGPQRWVHSGVVGSDWPVSNRLKAEWRFLRSANNLLERSRWVSSRSVVRFRSFAFERLVQQNLSAAVRSLSLNEVIITDRLHGHILCTLMRIPHIAVPDRYGKIAAYYNTWSTHDPVSHLADTFSSAVTGLS
jgi:exopolysaccharide biosynthesis predicted pyruvyltransferase EpsI